MGIAGAGADLRKFLFGITFFRADALTTEARVPATGAVTGAGAGGGVGALAGGAGYRDLPLCGIFAF